MDVSIRASDDDRRRVAAALERHTTAGRLDLDEFAERVGAANAARTLADLVALIQDLPPEPPAGLPADGPAPGGGHGQRRELLVVFAIAGATLLLLFLFMAVRS